MAKRKTKPKPEATAKPLAPHLQIVVDVLSSPKGLAIVGAIASSLGIALVGGLWDLYSRTNSLKTDADYSLRHGAWVDRNLTRVATTEPTSRPIEWHAKP
jgi:hypothetical protein